MQLSTVFDCKRSVVLGLFCLVLQWHSQAWANSSMVLQGQTANSTTWIDGNLRGWHDLEYIPSRVLFSGGPVTGLSISIAFDHGQPGMPGVENLSGFITSSNLVLTAGPTLRYTSAFGFWFYDVTVNVLDQNPGFVEFRSRLAAGAHLNPGSSLHLDGSSSLGVLQIHKPAGATGHPDLAVVKTGPARAKIGRIITYTLYYTNKISAVDKATAVQISDVLPAALAYVPGSASSGGRLVGNMLYWDMGAVASGASGSVTYQAVVNNNVADGQVFSNFAQIFSAEDDANYADNSSSVRTTAFLNHPPVANPDSYAMNEDTTLNVQSPGVLANDTDADGDPLTAIRLTEPSHGSLQFNSDGSFTYTPLANYNGRDSFTYQARDDMTTISAPVTVTITVNPVNDPPIASPDNYSVNMETPLVVGVNNGLLINDTDLDGNALTAIFVNGPAHGSLQFNADGTFTYLSATNFIGTDSFTYQASDGSLLSAAVPVTITVNAINHPPVANPDSYTVNMETPLVVAANNGVLVNDTDRDNNPITAILVGNPSHGNLQFSPDGAFSYAPATNFIGTDSFTYKASDGLLFSMVVPVTITVNAVNHAPVANPDSYTVNMETPLVVGQNNSVLANDTDRDNNPLTSILVDNVSHGTLQFGPDGTFTYTPATNYVGTDSFSYKASDGALFSAFVPVTITVLWVNHAPVANPDNYIVNMESPLVVGQNNGVLANDTDRDKTALTAALVNGPAHGSFQFQADGSHGTVQFKPDGTFVYTPAPDFFGTDAFTYKASDGSLASAPATVSITVNPVNHAPSFTKGPDQRINRTAAAQTVPHWATNIVPGPSYESNQTVIFYVSTDQTTLFSTQPALSPDGTLTYTPKANVVGRAVLTAFLKDNGGTDNGGLDTSAPQTFSILINGPPTARILEPANGVTFIAPAQFTILADAIDPDGSLSRVELRQGTSLLSTFTNAPYYLAKTNVAAGQYQFTALAVDYMDLKATSAPVNVTVLAGPPLQAGAIVLNAQTERFEQWVKISNPTPLTYTAARVYISNLPSTDAVHYPSGSLNGIPYMQVNASIPSGGSVWILIEYYVPSRYPSTPTLTGQLLWPTSTPPTRETPQRITQLGQLSNGQFQLEFSSAANRYYYVKYSDDFKTWKTALPCIAGTGTTIKWVDTGTPCTESRTSTQGGRYYKVMLLP